MAPIPPDAVDYVVRILDAFFRFSAAVEQALQQLKIDLATVEIESTGRNRLVPEQQQDEELYDPPMG